MSYNRKRRFHTQDQTMSDINVTPLVDVMLVLLIIFMVTAPLSKHGMELKLPKASTKALEKQEKYAITIYRNRALFFNDKPISNESLSAKLQQLVINNPAVDVFLRADETLPYGYVVKVMATARAAGVVNLGMVTEPLSVTR